MDWLFSYFKLAWAFTKAHPGIVMVLAGVVVEGAEIVSKIFWKEWFKRHEFTLDIISAVGWMVLVLGLMLEIPDAAKDDKIAAELRDRAKTLEKDAEQLKKDIEGAKQETERIRRENLVLSSNVLALKIKLAQVDPKSRPLRHIKATVSFFHVVSTNRPGSLNAAFTICPNDISPKSTDCMIFITTTLPAASIDSGGWGWPQMVFEQSFLEDRPGLFGNVVYRPNIHLLVPELIGQSIGGANVELVATVTEMEEVPGNKILTRRFFIRPQKVEISGVLDLELDRDVRQE